MSGRPASWRRRRRGALVALGLAVVACSPADDATTRAEQLERISEGGPPPAPCQPALADPADPVPDEPLALVRELVRRDADGRLLDWTPWLAGAVACPRRSEVPSLVTVVAEQDVRSLAAGGDSAWVLVTARAIGIIEPGYAGTSHFEAATTPRADTVLVVRTPLGWRVAPPVRRGMLHAPAALAHFSLDSGDVRRLRAAAAR